MARGKQRSGRTSRRRREASEVARWLDRRQQGGWTWAELSRRSSIPVSTLQWWKRRLADSSGGSLSSTGVTFVEATVVDSATAGSTSSGPCLVEFRSGHRLLWEQGLTEESLRLVLDRLRRG